MEKQLKIDPAHAEEEPQPQKQDPPDEDDEVVEIREDMRQCLAAGFKLGTSPKQDRQSPNLAEKAD